MVRLSEKRDYFTEVSILLTILLISVLKRQIQIIGGHHLFVPVKGTLRCQVVHSFVALKRSF